MRIFINDKIIYYLYFDFKNLRLTCKIKNTTHFLYSLFKNKPYNFQLLIKIAYNGL
jgi:hypothetical protein